jgi:acetolactate synthase-1/2/3 large subunit
VTSAVYGAPLAGAAVIEVPVELAEVFADAHRRVTGEIAGAHLGDGAPRLPAGEPASAAVADEAVARIDAAQRPVVLAGPGVVLEHAVDGLRALAEVGSYGVLNTWGAKGVFDWRSPHHLATAGLQARDFELGGLADADLIIATGIDEREARAGWRLAPVVDVAPTALRELADAIAPRERDIALPPLRAELAAITQAGWERATAPPAPRKVTQHYSQVFGGGGLVAADPGIAGYWVARTFATQQLGGALVTADPAARGFAVACATVARRADPQRAALAVVDVIDEATALALDAASRLGVAVPVEVWDPSGPVLDAAAHERRLRELVEGGGQAALATDPAQLDEMLAAAGPVVAWT